MAMYGKCEKRCASCIYWRGKRNIDFKHIETNERIGMCACEEGFYNIKTTEGSHCNDWKEV